MSVLKLRDAPSPGIDVLVNVASLNRVQLDDEPLIRLLLDETSGTTAYDTSGNDRDGSYIGSYTLDQTPINGNGSGSTDFSGGAVEIAYGSWMNVTDYTVEALVYPTSLSSYRGVATRDDESTHRCWAFRYNGGANGLVWHGSGTLTQVNGGSELSTNTPYLLHLACGQGGTKARAYRNGTQWVDGGDVGDAVSDTTIGMRVGQGSLGGSYAWAGRISHFAFYGEALSAATLAAHAAAAGLV